MYCFRTCRTLNWIVIKVRLEFRYSTVHAYLKKICMVLFVFITQVFFLFLLAFIVKYKIGEDVDLAEHFDNAEVTLNVSLSMSHTGWYKVKYYLMFICKISVNNLVESKYTLFVFTTCQVEKLCSEGIQETNLIFPSTNTTLRMVFFIVEDIYIKHCQ